MLYPVHTKPSVEAIEDWSTSDIPALSATADKIMTELGADWKDYLYTGKTAQGADHTLVDYLWNNHKDVDYEHSDTYFIGEPEHVKLTQAEYEVLANNELTFTDKPGDVSAGGVAGLANSGIIVLNSSRRAINQKFEGH